MRTRAADAVAKMTPSPPVPVPEEVLPPTPEDSGATPCAPPPPASGTPHPAATTTPTPIAADHDDGAGGAGMEREPALSDGGSSLAQVHSSPPARLLTGLGPVAMAVVDAAYLLHDARGSVRNVARFVRGRLDIVAGPISVPPADCAGSGPPLGGDDGLVACACAATRIGVRLRHGERRRRRDRQGEHAAAVPAVWMRVGGAGGTIADVRLLDAHDFVGLEDVEPPGVHADPTVRTDATATNSNAGATLGRDGGRDGRRRRLPPAEAAAGGGRLCGHLAAALAAPPQPYHLILTRLAPTGLVGGSGSGGGGSGGSGGGGRGRRRTVQHPLANAARLLIRFTDLADLPLAWALQRLAATAPPPPRPPLPQHGTSSGAAAAAVTAAAMAIALRALTDPATGWTPSPASGGAAGADATASVGAGGTVPPRRFLSPPLPPRR
ncbi:hypothetical protein MMPV_007486 [Pyropia vietnamensis]